MTTQKVCGGRSKCIIELQFYIDIYDNLIFPDAADKSNPAHLIKCKQILLKSFACFAVQRRSLLQLQPSQNSIHSVAKITKLAIIRTLYHGLLVKTA